MSEYEPFIDDPGHLRLLEGQRYVVLRPMAPVADVHVQTKRRLSSRFANLAISYPAQAHVTLAGFPSGTSLEALQSLVPQWAASVRPLRIAVEGVSSFPSPFQIVIVQVHKTPELFTALLNLREIAASKGLNPFAAIAVDDWVFHISVAYCRRLGSEAWARVTAFLQTIEAPEVKCIVYEAELVAYDNGSEHSGGSYRLNGQARD